MGLWSRAIRPGFGRAVLDIPGAVDLAVRAGVPADAAWFLIPFASDGMVAGLADAADREDGP